VNLRSIQNTVGRWHQRTFPDATVEDVTIKLMEEAGEVARAVHLRKYPRVIRDSVDLEKELCDVLLCVVEIGNRAGIDVQRVWAVHWPQIKDRESYN
jgi:NTP pyrophosphatase (non-canonical NTP hydrolase)